MAQKLMTAAMGNPVSLCKMPTRAEAPALLLQEMQAGTYQWTAGRWP